MKKGLSILLCACLFSAVLGAVPVSAATEPIIVMSLGDGYTEGGGYWNHSTSMKYPDAPGGSYTTSTDGWCRYEAAVPQAGMYQAEVYVLPTHAEFKNPSFVDVTVGYYDGNAKYTQNVDFYDNSGWVNLGTYPVQAGTNLSVRQQMKDVGDGGPNHRAAAVRFTYVGELRPESHNVTAYSFTDLGEWTLSDGYMLGTTAQTHPSTSINVKMPGTYKVWVYSKNYSDYNRTFSVSMDGTQLPNLVGNHKYNAETSVGSPSTWSAWQEAGTVELTAGAHRIDLKRMAGWVRCSNVFVTSDLNMVPDKEIGAFNAAYPQTSVTEYYPSADYPSTNLGEMTNEEVVSIENESYKLDFIKGSVNGVATVQNEIYIKHNNEWLKIKDKSEELGVLMMAAAKSELGQAFQSVSGKVFKQTLAYNKEEFVESGTNFYQAGYPYWFIPNDVVYVSDSEIQLLFPTRNGTELRLTYSFDDLCSDPKVSLNATFGKGGSYSFLLFSGDTFEESAMTRVTAPLLFNRKYVPTGLNTWSEEYLTTPLVTFTVNDKASDLVTYGLAVDPSVIPQDIAYADTARFGFSMRGNDGKLRAQLCAPMFGTEASNFKSGDSYAFSYRILGGVNDWYDTYRHVATDLYKVADIRTNYYNNLNEAIFNITDLIKDSYAGGWDDKSMGYYYSEYQEDEGHTNVLEEVQRYLLTEDEELLETRVIPTIAFLLSRGSLHFSRNVNNTNVSSYMVTTPSLKAGEDHIALYEMTGGRMPFLKRKGMLQNTKSAAGQEAMYRQTGDASYIEEIKAAADKAINLTLNDSGYMSTINRQGFILGDYTSYLDSILIAYENTHEQKYLDAAEELGRMLLTSLSTKGYQNGYDKNIYHVDPHAVANAHRSVSDGASWWWRHDIQWRLGFPYGEIGALSEKEDAWTQIDEEDVPGWLLSSVGLSTEHPRTAGHSNFILMNTWASQFVRLSKYTGDDIFETQARNAIVGRFGTYPGYYIDRYWTNYMKKEYMYDGPDYNYIYYTHVPQFLSILEDFLITTAWSKSDGKVTFPAMSTSGYSYFTSKQYGAKPGKMYDVDGLWLWNDRGIVTADNVNIDFVAGRKDGTLGLSFINEGNEDITTEITLGEKVPAFTGKANGYKANGSKFDVSVTDGKFHISVPAKGMVTVVLKMDGITAPGYASNRIYSDDESGTVNNHTNGRGYTIQLNDNEYFAYVYVTDKDLDSLTINYTVDGVSNSVTVNEFPFEKIIKVDSPEKVFSYSLTAVKNGVSTSYGSGTLKATSSSCEGMKVNVNGRDTSVIAGKAKNAGAEVAAVDKNGDAITKPTVLDAVYSYGLADNAKGRIVAYLNGALVANPDLVYVSANDRVTFEQKTDGFSPFCFGPAGSVITMMGGKWGKINKGVYKFTCPDYTKMQDVVPNIIIADSMRNMHINGVLTPAAGKLGAAEGEKLDGYVLFDNVPILQSALQSGTRVDFSFDGGLKMVETDYDQCLAKDENGNVLGILPKVVVLNQSNLYDTDKLYLTDKYTVGDVHVFDNDSHVLVSTDGVRDCMISVGTYDKGGRMTAVRTEHVLLTFNEPYATVLNPGERLFVFDYVNFSGTNMHPATKSK